MLAELAALRADALGFKLGSPALGGALALSFDRAVLSPSRTASKNAFIVNVSGLVRLRR